MAWIARPSTIISGPHNCFRGGPRPMRLDAARPIEWYRNAANRGPITLPVVCDG